MKKHIISLLALMVLVFVVSVQVFADERVLMDTFDDMAIGSVPAQWRAETADSIPVYGVAQRDGQDRFLDIKRNSSNNNQRLVRHFAYPVTGDNVEVMLELMMKKLDIEWETTRVTVSLADENGVSICGMVIYNDAHMAVTKKSRAESNTKWVAIDPLNQTNMRNDTFASIRFLIDTNKSRFKMYLNGVSYPADSGGIPVWEDYTGGRAPAQLIIASTLSSYDNAIGIDNVKVITDKEFTPNVIFTKQGDIIPTLEPGMVRAGIYAQNMNDEDRPVAVVLGLYKNNLLVDFSYCSEVIRTGTEQLVEIGAEVDVPDTQLSGYRLEVFVLEDYNYLTPLGIPYMLYAQ